MINPKFKPNMKTLQSILKVMMQNGTRNKSELAVDTNLNYSRLAKHIIWLESQEFVKSIIVESQIHIEMTEKGRLFAKTIL